MKKNILIILLLISGFADAQIDKLWESQYQITSDTFETFGYKTDGAGSFYLYGRQHNKPFIQKHDQNGNIIWMINDTALVYQGFYIYNGDTFWYRPSDSYISDISFDSHNNVVLCGIMLNRIVGWPDEDVYSFTTKVDPNGQIIWKRTFIFIPYLSSNGLTQWKTNCTIVTELDSANSYLLFSPIGTFGSCPGGPIPHLKDIDIGLIKVDKSGNIIWAKQYQASSNFCSRDDVSEIFLRNDTLILTSFSEARNKADCSFLNLILDTSGKELKRRIEKNYFITKKSNSVLKGNSFLTAYEIADSTDKNLRSIKVVQYDTATSPVLRDNKPLDSSVRFGNAQFDDSLNTYLGGIGKRLTSIGATVQKLASWGTITGDVTFNDSAVSNIVALNSKREILSYTSTLGNGNTGLIIGKIDKQFNLAWKSNLPGKFKILHSISGDSCNFYVVVQMDSSSSHRLVYLKFHDTTCLNDPHNLAITAKGNSWITLEWTISDTVDYRDGLKILRSTNGINFTVLDSVTRNTLFYKDSTLLTNTRYHYKVIAFNQYASSAYSNTVSDSIVINGLAPIAAKKIILYPNPVAEILIISAEVDIDRVRVFDITGTLKLSESGINEINMALFPPGVYLIQINEQHFFKILKL